MPYPSLSSIGNESFEQGCQNGLVLEPHSGGYRVEPPAFYTRPGDKLIKKLEELRERQEPLPETSAS